MPPRTRQDDYPRDSMRPPAQRRRSPGLNETYYDDRPARRGVSPDGPRGPAQRRYPRQNLDEPRSRYSPPPAYRNPEPADPLRGHRRRHTTDDWSNYDRHSPRPLGRDDDRQKTWHPKQKHDLDLDRHLPRRYRSSGSPEPARRDRQSATHHERGRERDFSASRDYDKRPRARPRDTIDERDRNRDRNRDRGRDRDWDGGRGRGRTRDDVYEQPRHRRGRAHSLDSENKIRSKEQPRAGSYGPRKTPSSKVQSTKTRSAKAAALDLPWGTLAAAAFQAGATAAYKARGDPGPWMGKKGTKVATAALGAAIVDTMGSKFKMGGSGKKR